MARTGAAHAMSSCVSTRTHAICMYARAHTPARRRNAFKLDPTSELGAALRAMPWQGLWFHGRLRMWGGAFATGYFWCGPWNGEPYTLWFTWRSDNGSLAWFRVRGSAVLESESSTSSEASESPETVD